MNAVTLATGAAWVKPFRLEAEGQVGKEAWVAKLVCICLTQTNFFTLFVKFTFLLHIKGTVDIQKLSFYDKKVCEMGDLI